MEVTIPFSILKTAQATAVLIRAENAPSMGRMRLLKLLYITDRALLQTRGRPITGDMPVAMDHGPVLTQTYSLIKGQHLHAGEWQKFFHSESYRVVMVADPGLGELSQKEIAALQDVVARYAQVEDFDLSEITHMFPEWEQNRPAAGSCKTIPLADVFQATGQLKNMESILAAARAETAFKQLVAE